MSLVKNLYLKFDDFQLQVDECELLDQGVTCLWGASGSGKTTFLRILLGLEPQASYNWIFKDEDLSLMSPPERRLSFVLQEHNLFDHLSVKDNILFPVLARKEKLDEDRFEFLLKKLEISKLLKQKAFSLSGGEAQRVALARALILKPRFLFLDEPFSHLDLELRKKSYLLLEELVLEEKIPTLLITHFEEERKNLADKTIFIEKGKIKEKG